MKVSELIEALQKMPQNAQVFYIADEDVDYPAEHIFCAHLHPANDEKMAEYWSQGESDGAWHLRNHPNDDCIVAISCSNDFPVYTAEELADIERWKKGMEWF